MPHYRARKQTTVKRATIEPLIPETDTKSVTQNKAQTALAGAINRVKQAFAWTRGRKVNQ